MSQALADYLYWLLIYLGKIQEIVRGRESQNKGVVAACSSLCSPLGQMLPVVLALFASLLKGEGTPLDIWGVQSIPKLQL